MKVKPGLRKSMEREFRNEDRKLERAQSFMDEPLTRKRIGELLGKPRGAIGNAELSQKEQDRVLDEILTQKRTDAFMEKLGRIAGQSLTTSRAFYVRRFYYNKIKPAVYNAQKEHGLSLEETEKLLDAIENRAAESHARQWKAGRIQSMGWALRNKFRRKTPEEKRDRTYQKLMAKAERKNKGMIRDSAAADITKVIPSQKKAPEPKKGKTPGRFRRWVTALAAVATLGLASPSAPVEQQRETPKTAMTTQAKPAAEKVPDRNLEKGKGVVRRYEDLDYQARRTNNQTLRDAIRAYQYGNYSNARTLAQHVTKTGHMQLSDKEKATLSSEAATGRILGGGARGSNAEISETASDEDMAVAAMLVQKSTNAMAEKR
ncbi:Uncharacterised protein [Candidatus Norongarragalina meridionalis]|nr:Uncharacterised protein [Candidatus Norongarragalina meridionalis]